MLFVYNLTYHCGQISLIHCMNSQATLIIDYTADTSTSRFYQTGQSRTATFVVIEDCEVIEVDCSIGYCIHCIEISLQRESS